MTAAEILERKADEIQSLAEEHGLREGYLGVTEAILRLVAEALEEAEREIA